MAAALACGDECRVSHRSAAVLLEPRPGGATVEPVEVTMRRRHRRSMAGIRVHLARDLAPDEVTTVHGIPVTTPARTLLDLGECLGPRELEQALARAERSGLVTREEVRAMVRRHRAFVEDRRRDAELMAAGYRVLRVTWPDLTREPEATLVRLAQALAHGPGSAG
jgi:predicted transcriptional regulator of viral defense system